MAGAVAVQLARQAPGPGPGEVLLEEDRDYLVVVGALHFVGRDGLLALLRSDGHKAVAVPAAKSSR